MSDAEKKELETLLRQVIRQELDKHDRDKGITPRMGSDGRRRDMYPPGTPSWYWP